MKSWQRIILFVLLSTLGMTATATQTTLVFDIPSPDLDTNRNYTLGDLFTSRQVVVTPGRPAQTVYDLKPITNEWRRTFGQGSAIDKFFVREIVQAQQELIDDARAEILADSKVRSIDYVRLIQKPMDITLGVRGNHIELGVTGFSIEAKADFNVPGGPGRVICGSSVRATIRADISATGRYDPASGSAFLSDVNVEESVNVECSSILGKIFDFAFEFAADYFVEDLINDEINSVLQESVNIGSLNSIISNEAIQASNALGFNFARDAWAALERYVDGLTLRFRIGVDYYGTGKHLLGFGAFQEAVSFVVSSSGSSWARSSEATISCPSWANDLKVYESTKVQTGTRRVGRIIQPVYGARKFRELSVNGTSYTRDLGCSGRLCNRAADRGVVASCRSFNGLWSYPIDSGVF